MFEKGKCVYFKDGNFNTHFGTILEKISEDSATVTLKVQSKYGGGIYTVKKVRFQSEEAAERFYCEHGHY